MAAVWDDPLIAHPGDRNRLADLADHRGDQGVAAVKDLTGGLGAHSAIEAVGTQESMMQAIRSARPGGHVGYVGVAHGVDLELPLEAAAAAPSRSCCGHSTTDGRSTMLYKHLGHTGLQVSRLVLGTMNFGDATGEAASFTIMDGARPGRGTPTSARTRSCRTWPPSAPAPHGPAHSRTGKGGPPRREPTGVHLPSPPARTTDTHP
jgi:hypothetical protein